jgi:hypothetical protein
VDPEDVVQSAYTPRVQVAAIEGIIDELIACYKLQDERFERLEERMRKIEKDKQLGAILTTGKLAPDWKAIDAGNPALYGAASGYLDSLESARRRTKAGQRWDPQDAEAFLRDAHRNLITLNLAITLQERAVTILYRKANAATTPGVVPVTPRR